MPLAVAYRTVTDEALAADSETVNTKDLLPLLPSVADTSLMVRAGMGGASSLVMVPKPCASVMVAPLALLRLTKNVSLASTSVSPVTFTVIVFAGFPGCKRQAGRGDLGQVSGTGGTQSRGVIDRDCRGARDIQRHGEREGS